MKAKLREHKKDILIVLLVCIWICLFFLNSNKVQGGSSEISAMSNEVNTEKMKIALTFDDGPHPYYTEQILDGLKDREVKATFFITGQNAQEHPEIVKRIDEEGHIIGNHTYSHMQLTNSNADKFKQELIDTNEVIKEITGDEVIYVRPPYGCWNKELERELYLFPVLWTVDPLDWCNSDASCIAQRVISKAEDNAIILLHDGYKSTVTATFQIIDELSEKGYVFVTVEDILFD